MCNNSNIMGRDRCRIVITDSGLGGLSVQALLDSKLQRFKKNINLELIYFNAISDKNVGYNSIAIFEERIKLFDSALKGINDLNPDIILIACNTLSVLYPHTEFAKKTQIKVIGIVESGVDLISENLNDSEKDIILFGTETTINSNAHMNQLVKLGVNKKNIVPQICKSLESEIQDDCSSINVKNLITQYVDESSKKLTNSNNVLGVLCCTHYFFSKDIFINVMKEKLGEKFQVLDPNERMADFVISYLSNLTGVKQIDERTIENRVYSKVKLFQTEIDTLGAVIQSISPNVQKALLNYELSNNLFQVT